MLSPEQGEQPRGQSFGKWVRWVEHDGCDALAMVKDDLTTAVKHVAYHAHDAPLPYSGHRGAEPLTSPHNRVVRQGIQLRHHLLRLKALLVAFGHAQALLVAFDRRFHPTAALIIDIHIGQQDSAWVLLSVDRLAAQGDHLLRREGRDQHAHAPLAVLFATTHRDPTYRTAIAGGGDRHPADLALRQERVVHPLHHTLGPRVRPSPQITNNHHVRATVSPPVALAEPTPTGTEP